MSVNRQGYHELRELSYNGRLILSGLPENPPDDIAVVAVKFAGGPQRMPEKDSAAWLEA